jgi:hypothetical protein
MGIYEPLARFLSGLEDDSWTASFVQIEDKLGFDLPPSARKYPQWWSNEAGKGHSQKEGWRSVGWKTKEVNLRGMTVRFVKARDQAMPAVPSLAELWRRASEISEITDREDLERAALTCFMQREAGRHLAAMGGTMPDLEIPPRRRAIW